MPQTALRPRSETRPRKGRLACDVCDSTELTRVLECDRLDGPLVRCEGCGLVFVGRRTNDFTFTAVDGERSGSLRSRVRALDLVRIDVERHEASLRVEVERDRLSRLLRHTSGGKLLDVGCATGEFMKVAASHFDPYGVEPDPVTCAQARDAGLRVISGTLDQVIRPLGGFDAVTMFHVIEHLDSPSKVLRQVRELLRPGGTVMIETPTTDTLWFRLARRRWRQLLPDHYYFFNRSTLERVLRGSGLEPVAYGKFGRRVSLLFLADRARRSRLPLAGALAAALGPLHLADKALYVNPGDIMTVLARRPS